MVFRDKADVNAAVSTDQQQIDANHILDTAHIEREKRNVHHRHTVCGCNYRIVEEKITWKVFRVVTDHV